MNEQDPRRHDRSAWSDPRLDVFRVPNTGLCWWCGDRATTAEHRFKHSSLRRVARYQDGTSNASNVFKKSHSYEGPLNSLAKGSEVRWTPSLCAPCNNSRSQPFDLVYDRMDAYVAENLETIGTSGVMDWSKIYPDDPLAKASDLGRYFVKQFCCMLASQNLPIPAQTIEFLDGEATCPAVGFYLTRDIAIREWHRLLKGMGEEEGLAGFIRIPSARAWTSDGKFAGMTYLYQIGFITFSVDWREGTTQPTWWDALKSQVPWGGPYLSV